MEIALAVLRVLVNIYFLDLRQSMRSAFFLSGCASQSYTAFSASMVSSIALPNCATRGP